MDHMKEFVEEIWEELNGAMEYAKLACEHKEHDRSQMAAYSEMAMQELGHVDKISEMAEKYLASMPSADHHHEILKSVWSWEKERIMERKTKIRSLAEMCK